MKKVIFSTNLPSPYRVDFFNELGKYCDLIVLYERKNSSERDKKWIGELARNYQEVYLELDPVGTDQSKGNALKEYIKKSDFDILIFTNYVSPATIKAILYCRIHRISYYIEYDGGFNKKDSILKWLMKKILLKGANGHFTTADEHFKYLRGLGIQEKYIYKYPFTSIDNEDLKNAQSEILSDKCMIKQKLGMHEDKVVLSVGRFSYDKGYGKGYDVLLKVARKLSQEIGVYIVGDEPTQEFIDLKEQMNLNNVHFVGFKTKQELKDYYLAADLFILLTRGDIWGLVVNEAMMYGLPVITTRYCIAGTELVIMDETGYIVELDDPKHIASITEKLLNDDARRSNMAQKCMNLMNKYTIEVMAECHVDIFNML